MTSFESIGGVPVDVFQGLPSNSVHLCLTSWANQKKSAKTSNKIVDLHKSGSSLGAISKRLKVPRSSVQTILRKYKHHGTTQLSHRSGGDAFCLLEINVLWYEKCKSIPEQQQGPCEDAGGNRYKSIYTHSKMSPMSPIST